MKVIKRMIYGLMFASSIILIITAFLWWFIPELFFGVNHKKLIHKYVDFIYEYGDGLFQR